MCLPTKTIQCCILQMNILKLRYIHQKMSNTLTHPVCTWYGNDDEYVYG